jgi:O-antigen/teichoic acid export membrane protein
MKADPSAQGLRNAAVGALHAALVSVQAGDQFAGAYLHERDLQSRVSRAQRERVSSRNRGTVSRGEMGLRSEIGIAGDPTIDSRTRNLALPEGELTVSDRARRGLAALQWGLIYRAALADGTRVNLEPREKGVRAGALIAHPPALSQQDPPQCGEHVVTVAWAGIGAGFAVVTLHAMSGSVRTVDDAPPQRKHGAGRLLPRLGGLVTRHTLIYIAGSFAVGPAGLISVVITTRLLGASKYGELGVLFVFAGFATMLYNTGSLHGTFMYAYGATEGEGDDVGARGKITSNHKRALGTGVVLTLAIVSAGTAFCFLLAPQIAELLHIHNPDGPALVRWAAVSAATGSLWRLTVNVFRMERKPVRFAIFNSMRPLFVVATTVPLLVLGYELQGVLAGTAFGTLVASAVCIAMARHCYAPAFSWSDVKEIVKRGSLVVVPVTCLYIAHSADTVLVSQFMSGAAVGTYRVATRFAVLPSYFASSFLMAWSPLEHGVLFQSTYRQTGEERVRGAILTYYLLAGMTIVVLLDVFANVLTLLAGPEYSPAAPLIPLIGVGFVCYGLFIVLVRLSKIEKTMMWFAFGAILATVVEVGLAIVTIPWLGAYGAPVATTAGLLAACLMWIVVVTRVMKGSFSFEKRPLLGLGVAVSVATVVQVLGLSIWPAGRPFVLALVLVSYVTTVLALRVVPRRHFGLLRLLARATVRQRVAKQDPTGGLERLDLARRSLLATLERDRVPIAVLADRTRRDEREISHEYIATLREIIAASPGPDWSAELEGSVADYLLSDRPESQRDVMAHELLEEGLEGLELVELNEAAQRLRALPGETWSAWTTNGHPVQDHKVRLKELIEILSKLPESDRRAALMILRDGRTAAEAAQENGMPEQLAAARVVRVLRAAGNLGKGTPDDAAIGIAVFGLPSALIPPNARAVALVFDQVRGFSRRQWQRALPPVQPRRRSLATSVRRRSHPDHSQGQLSQGELAQIAFGEGAPLR